MAWKIKMKEGMTQAWLHMTCAYLNYDAEQISEIDDKNKKMAWNKIEPDASLEVLGSRNAYIVLDALFTLFFKEKYRNQQQTPEVRDDKFNWYCVISQNARLLGYKKYLDGRQMRATGHITRRHPTSGATFDSFFSIGVMNQHCGESLLSSIDVYNHLNRASIFCTSNNTLVTNFRTHERGKIIETNWVN